jgi:thymidylate synthase (FAD)
MLILVKEVAPVLFKKAGSPCTYGQCPEGAMSCGNARR